MAFKEVYDCEILISEIENRPALYDCSMKEYSDKSFKDILWGEVCEAVISEWSQLDSPEKRAKGKQCCFSIYLIQMHRRRKNQRLTQVKMFIHFRLTQHVSGIIMPIVRRQTE